MRYALNIGAAGDGRDPESFAELAALAERSGWHAMLLEDYVVYGGTPEPAPATYDIWVTLAAMAVATERLLLGTDVTPTGTKNATGSTPSPKPAPPGGASGCLPRT